MTSILIVVLYAWGGYERLRRVLVRSDPGGADAASRARRGRRRAAAERSLLAPARRRGGY
jgi:hypothetical protein